MTRAMVRLFLVASLIANGVLLVLLSLAPSPVAKTSIASATPRPLAGAAASATVTAAPRSRGSTWAELNDAQPEVLVARLRAAGFPPRVLHAVVEVLVDERFRDRHKKLYRVEDDVPFWREPRTFFERDESRLERTRLAEESESMRKALLGADYVRVDEEVQFHNRQAWGFLSPEKTARVLDLHQRYGELQSQLQAPDRNVPEATREKLLALDRERRAELERLLTPAELENHDRRNSAAAGYLQYSSLQAMRPTEAEYIALYGLYRPFEEQFTWRHRDATAEEIELHRRIDASLQPQIKAVLGPDRYADYLHARQPEYRQLNSLVARLELPVSAARSVATVQQETTRRAEEVRNNAALTTQQRQLQLAALAREATTKITGTLSARGFEAYKSYGGQWLTTMLPPSTPTAKPPP